VFEDRRWRLFGAKQPSKEASGKRIGILVMEMPYTSVANDQDATQKGAAIGREGARYMPSFDSK
jgi:hypothetical protein